MAKRNVENEETTGAVGNNNDARVAMLDRINDRYDHLRADELRDVNDDDTTGEFTPNEVEPQPSNEEEEKVSPAENEEQPEEQPEEEEEKQKEEIEAAPAAPEKHKLVVNGQVFELTTEELIARAQKVAAADQYLEEAARAKREAEKVVQLPLQQDAANAALERRRALVRAIQMGTEEEAMAALDELQKGAAPVIKGPSSDDLTKMIDERLTFNEAVEKFQSEYNDITSDPVLLQLALQKDAELIKAGDRRGYYERYKEIGDFLRTWKNGLMKQTEKKDTGTPISNEKQERKQAAPTAVKGASVKAPASANEEEKEESPAEIIAKMAEARGGSQRFRG